MKRRAITAITTDNTITRVLSFEFACNWNLSVGDTTIEQTNKQTNTCSKHSDDLKRFKTVRYTNLLTRQRRTPAGSVIASLLTHQCCFFLLLLLLLRKAFVQEKCVSKGEAHKHPYKNNLGGKTGTDIQAIIGELCAFINNKQPHIRITLKGLSHLSEVAR